MTQLTYETFFGLSERPFSLSSDPKFLYQSQSHAIAFENLLTGIQRREGLLVLTGDIGTGKTTLCRAVLQNLPRKTFSALVPDPFASREDLLKMLLIDFGVMSVHDLASGRLKGATRTELSYLLYDFLDTLVPLEAFVIVIIDEAQNMSLSLIEEIRILSDLNGRRSPLQVLFVGQLELREKLKLPEMRQVDQRVSAHCSLEALTPGAVSGYVAHRLRVAGGSPDRVQFSQEALDAVYTASGGVPRLINRICDRALHHSYLGRLSIVDRTSIEAAILEAGRPELPGALRAAAPPPAKPVTPLPSIAASEPASGSVDTWLTGVEAGLPSLTDSGGGLVGATVPAAVAAPRRPQWVLGSEAKTSSRRRRFPYGFRFPARSSAVQKRSLRWVAAVLVGVAALGGMGFGVSRLPGVFDVTAAPLPAAPSIVVPTGSASALPNAVPALSNAAGSPPNAPAILPSAAAEFPNASAASPDAAASARAAAEGSASGGYVVEVALFTTSQRGARLVDELAAASFRAYQRPLDLGSRGFYRQVLIGPFATRAEADSDLERLHRRGGYADARVSRHLPRPKL